MTFLNTTRRHLPTALAAAVAVSFGATSPAVANDTIHTEGLTNKILSPNETENWPSQTLNDAATGVVITSTAVDFQDDNGPGYGPTQTSAWFPHSFTCTNTHNYIQTIQ